ncbi:MAG: RepB family DNA primase, partial [Pseudomonadota bacterium]|nr:RepB family DNA primase [Pseudomonadota bacterium]
MTDLAPIKTGFHPNRSLEELRRTIGKALHTATSSQQNFIIRPRSTTTTLIQLDDLTAAKADRIAPHAFMVLETSPGNFQAWVAVEKEASEDFSRRLRKGNGSEPFADLSASGATRIAGSRNFKTKYAPAFPLVAITQTNPGNVSNSAMLELAGFVAPPEQTRPATKAAAFRISPERRSRKAWPSYQICIQGAPRANGEDKPDISRADFTW